MEPKNLTDDPTALLRAQALLVEGEFLIAVIQTPQRRMTVTSNRLILNERSGGWSAIRNSQIAAVDVSPGQGSERYVDVFFGGGLKRTLGVPSDEAARLIASALAWG